MIQSNGHDDKGKGHRGTVAAQPPHSARPSINAYRIIPALALLLLMQMVSADPACDSAQALDVSNWKVLSAIALMVSFSFIGLIYIAGRVFDNNRLTNMAKNDLQQTVITAVMVFVIFTPLVLGICSFRISFSGLGSDMTLFEGATKYFDYARAVALNSFSKASSATMWITGMSNIYVGSGYSINSFSINLSPWSSLSVLTAITSSIMNWLLLQIAIADAQKVIVDVVQASFLGLLLPAGIVLRSFAPLRQIGGILIAIALGLFLIHPLVFSLSYMLIGAPAVPSYEATNYTPKLLGYIAVIAGAVITANLMKMAGPLLIVTLLLGIWPMTINETINIATGTMTGLGTTLFVVLVLPSLAWIYIAAFVRDISRMLGEEIDISSLSRLI